MLDPALQKAITDSKVLAPEMRERILKAGDKLTPEQVQQMLKLIADAEAQHAQAMAELETKKREINQKYIEGVNDFLKHGVPKIMKDIEVADREGEEKELENILSEADKA